jgi:hypothetical protein
MDSGSNDITFNTEIYFQYQPQIQLGITRNDAIKLIFEKLFSVSQNAHCDPRRKKKTIISRSLLLSQITRK